MQEISRRKPILKNRVSEHIERSVVELGIENPALGQVRVSNELRKQNVIVSSGCVRDIWKRHDIEQLQNDLDFWVNEYNTNRSHSGKFCFEKRLCKPLWNPSV